jgi:predicted nucleotidyltransferase
MRRIDPALVPVITDLARGLRELGVPFGVVGALVPELLLEVRPTRMTNDADVTVMVETLADFEVLKDRLAAFGFARTRAPHRMRHQSGGLVDILPFSESLAPDGRLELQEDLVLNMAGFSHVVRHAVATPIEGGPTLPLAPLPLYVLLKLAAF